MDPDACPTEWPPLLRIRRENANYTIGANYTIDQRVSSSPEW